MNRNNDYLAIGIAGSPRRRGNSTSLLRAYLDGTSQVGFETRIISMNDLIYKGCQGCDRCVRGEACGIQDDPREYYAEVANHRAEYFNWKDRGDFQKVRVFAAANLGPADAWKKRPDLQRR